tara:strand:+ start:1401 stop:2069 length:669 start_codon:yes stop_codon:yes gene_type:complete
MALKIRSLLEGIEFEGYELTYIVDDELDVGEVYLDGTLLYQADDVISERQLDIKFRHDFVVEDIDDELLGLEDDKIDYTIEGVQTGLFTTGAKYMTKSGKEYIGDYHVHPGMGPMIGKFHDPNWTNADKRRVMLDDIEDNEMLMEARLVSAHLNIDYTVDEDVYPHIGGERDPLELTDHELIEEQRKATDLKRFRILEEDGDDEFDTDNSFDIDGTDSDRDY